ncbi:hypothetical protein MMC19_004936 [Ptychographa xylographoides]|nr:hypothetical protein [Ptychographa xylographoides]
MSEPEIPTQDEEDDMLDADEAAEVVLEDGDHPMDSDPEDVEEQEINLQNDSIAHFDHHSDSLFCITSHPLISSIIATGGGDDIAYIFSSSTTPPLLPTSYESNPEAVRKSIEPIAQLKGHTDSVNAVAFTLPRGDFLCTAGLDGRLRAYTTPPSPIQPDYKFIAEVQEVEEINWLAPCPNPTSPNTIALGASDGSVWIYTIEGTDPASALTVQQAYYLHTASCTAGSWSSDGKFLATVSEDGSLYVWNPFGEPGVSSGSGQTVVGLTADDQRFAVEGGLYSVAIAPSGAFVAVGGTDGNIRVVGLPRPTSTPVPSQGGTIPQKGGAKNKTGGGKLGGASTSEGSGQAGQILASLQAQGDGVETLAFSAPPLTLLAAGSVDGSIVLFDTAHRFAVRRHIKDAHDEYAVVKVEFLAAPSSTGFPKGSQSGGWLLTSCGMDGAVRRWDTRGGTAASGQGLVGEWKGHRGDGEGGGVMGFVQMDGEGSGRIVTAGDDGISLVFEAGGRNG